VVSVAGRLKQLSRDTARAEPFVFALFVQGAAAAGRNQMSPLPSKLRASATADADIATAHKAAANATR